MTCEYLDVCPSPREIGTGPIYKRRYCLHDCHRCARFHLLSDNPAIEVPRWLRPTMMAHAEQVLEARLNGFTRIPEKLPGGAAQRGMIFRGNGEQDAPADNEYRVS